MACSTTDSARREKTLAAPTVWVPDCPARGADAAKSRSEIDDPERLQITRSDEQVRLPLVHGIEQVPELPSMGTPTCTTRGEPAPAAATYL